MKTLKGLTRYRFPIFPTEEKSYFKLFRLVILISMVSACNDKSQSDLPSTRVDKSNLSASSGSNRLSSGVIDAGLSTLYLENFSDTSKNQLARLLSDQSHKKLVFQFYKLKDGRLTLVAFAGKQNNRDFSANYQILGIVNDSPVEDIGDKEVFLGDQKLDNDSGFKLLKEAVNTESKSDSSNNYVIFTPELKRFSASGSYVVEFSITFTNSLRDLNSQILPVSRAKLNPSPPY